jgi:sarcosine oxidase
LSKRYDVIVIGLGAMGSAAAAHLSARGFSVLGLDRFRPPHEMGSSHGESRIIRAAYFEDPVYVPMVLRAFELWRKLEADSGAELLQASGVLLLGRPESEVIAGSRRSAEIHQIPHRALSSKEIATRFPALRPSVETIGLLEPDGGILFPEQCVLSHLELAYQRGAELRFGEPVRSWKASENSIEIKTDSGRFHSARLIIAAGPWASQLLSELQIPLHAERQVSAWFQPNDPQRVQVGEFPVFLWEYESGRLLYGVPDLGRGVKAALHHQGTATDADRTNRRVEPDEAETIRSLLQRLAPAAAGPQQHASVCLYTNSPDHHFLIDFHPHSPRVLILSPCSGHGFKFAPVVGELATDLVSGEKPRFDLNRFRLSRFQEDGRRSG